MNVLQRCRTLLLLYFAPMLVALARPDRLNELFRFSRQFRRSEQSMGMDIFVGYVGRETHVGRGRPARNRKTADARRGPHLEGPETLGCRGGCVPRLRRDWTCTCDAEQWLRTTTLITRRHHGTPQGLYPRI